MSYYLFDPLIAACYFTGAYFEFLRAIFRVIILRERCDGPGDLIGYIIIICLHRSRFCNHVYIYTCTSIFCVVVIFRPPRQLLSETSLSFRAVFTMIELFFSPGLLSTAAPRLLLLYDHSSRGVY